MIAHNRQIAENTAGNHVRAIVWKLGLTDSNLSALPNAKAMSHVKPNVYC